jgi:putative hydrolase of the HAD superfamily
MGETDIAVHDSLWDCESPSVHISSDLGFRKPDLGFYKAVQDKIQVPASEILFWDDSLENVTAAREAGWKAEVFTNLEQFDQLMKHHKI